MFQATKEKRVDGVSTTAGNRHQSLYSHELITSSPLNHDETASQREVQMPIVSDSYNALYAACSGIERLLR
jgi:hypothetical protein